MCATDVRLGSCMQNEADAYRKIRLRVEDVQGRNCLTNFWVRPLPAGVHGLCMHWRRMAGSSYKVCRKDNTSQTGALRRLQGGCAHLRVPSAAGR